MRLRLPLLCHSDIGPERYPRSPSVGPLNRNQRGTLNKGRKRLIDMI